MCPDTIKYKYPVKRMGNEENPKLVILVLNPGGNPMDYQNMPEYMFDQVGRYSPAGMDFGMFRAAEPWWDKLISPCMGNGFSDDDILTLEYYPFHSVNQNGFPKNKNEWEPYALESLRENTVLLRRAMANGAVVISFFCSEWESQCPDVRRYPHYHRCNAGFTNKKRLQFQEFIAQESDYLASL